MPDLRVSPQICPGQGRRTRTGERDRDDDDVMWPLDLLVLDMPPTCLLRGFLGSDNYQPQQRVQQQRMWSVGSCASYVRGPYDSTDRSRLERMRLLTSPRGYKMRTRARAGLK